MPENLMRRARQILPGAAFSICGRELAEFDCPKGMP